MFDQLHMGFRVFRAHSRLRKQIEAAALYLNIFAVLKWQIEEHLVGFWKLLIQAFLNGRLGDRERFRILGEGRGTAAVKISRKLIENNNESQRALRRLRPMIQFTRRGALMRFTKMSANLRVEIVAVLPPFRAHLLFDDILKPKIEYCADLLVHCYHPARHKFLL